MAMPSPPTGAGRLKLLLSAATAQRLGPALQAGPRPVEVLVAEDLSLDEAGAAEAAFISRDITGRSTKQVLAPATAQFYRLLQAAPSLRWVHVHSAGADRPAYQALRARGVRITTSSGANAEVVAQSALAGVLALARELPRLAEAQRAHRWAPPPLQALPADLHGQTAVIVGWGPIGQALARYLGMLGLQVRVVRRQPQPAGPGLPTVPYGRWHELLPRADWLLLACPLSDETRGLVDDAALQRLPPGARLVNVARGEVVQEPALLAALRSGRLAGAFLDVHAQEPLPPESPLWSMPGVICTPHCAGFSAGNEARVDRLFLDNLAAWRQGAPLRNEVAAR